MNITLQKFQLCTCALFQVGILLVTKLIKCFKLFYLCILNEEGYQRYEERRKQSG